MPSGNDDDHWWGGFTRPGADDMVLAVAVYKAEGEFYATQDLCTHERAYLSDGVVVDCVVECPFHQGRFDVKTGEALGAPVIIPLQTYPVRVVDGRIFVNVTREQAEAG